MRNDTLADNIQNPFELLPVRRARKQISKITRSASGYSDLFTWVKSGSKHSDNEYNDYIVGTHGYHAQGSADVALGGKHFYGNNEIDRAIWRSGERARKVGYRRYEHVLTTGDYVKVDRATVNGHVVINAIITTTFVSFRITDKNGRLIVDASCPAGTIVKHEGVIK